MTERKLLFSVTKKDLRIDTFRAGGKGGQNQNTRDTGVRITHPASGAVGESREERSQLQNKRKAFLRMVESKAFESWRRRRVAEMTVLEQEIQAIVERQMRPENLRVEVKDEKGRWTEADG